jgi:hypothetical protein|nr:hypothetical protein BN1235_p43 [Acinetobacter baumannii]
MSGICPLIPMMMRTAAINYKGRIGGYLTSISYVTYANSY